MSAAMRDKVPPPPGRPGEAPQPEIDAFRARHLALAQREIVTEFGRRNVTVDEAESPLAWLARRRGRDGRALIEPQQFQAGERLRADFTSAHLLPRTTSNWESPIATGRRGAGEGAAAATDAMVAARQRVHRALAAVGPEFAGLLLDVCCFLKRLEDVERERTWPLRSAKVVLQLALDGLARHYGYAAETRGHGHAALRTWLAEGAGFGVGGE
jgi:Domain of unknown function (DUF6456)